MPQEVLPPGNSPRGIEVPRGRHQILDCYAGVPPRPPSVRPASLLQHASPSALLPSVRSELPPGNLAFDAEIILDDDNDSSHPAKFTHDIRARHYSGSTPHRSQANDDAGLCEPLDTSFPPARGFEDLEERAGIDLRVIATLASAPYLLDHSEPGYHSSYEAMQHITITERFEGASDADWSVVADDRWSVPGAFWQDEDFEMLDMIDEDHVSAGTEWQLDVSGLALDPQGDSELELLPSPSDLHLDPSSPRREVVTTPQHPLPPHSLSDSNAKLDVVAHDAAPPLRGRDTSSSESFITWPSTHPSERILDSPFHCRTPKSPHSVYRRTVRDHGSTSPGDDWAYDRDFEDDIRSIAAMSTTTALEDIASGSVFSVARDETAFTLGQPKRPQDPPHDHGMVEHFSPHLTDDALKNQNPKDFINEIALRGTSPLFPDAFREAITTPPKSRTAILDTDERKLAGSVSSTNSLFSFITPLSITTVQSSQFEAIDQSRVHSQNEEASQESAGSMVYVGSQGTFFETPTEDPLAGEALAEVDLGAGLSLWEE